MARGNYNSGSIWAPGRSADGAVPEDTLAALTVIGEGLARIGGELARLGDGTARPSGPARASFTGASTLPWDGFDPTADAAATISALDARVGDYILRVRSDIEALADWENSRPSPRATVIQATQDWLSRLDPIGPSMWRQNG